MADEIDGDVKALRITGLNQVVQDGDQLLRRDSIKDRAVDEILKALNRDLGLLDQSQRPRDGWPYGTGAAE